MFQLKLNCEKLQHETVKLAARIQPWYFYESFYAKIICQVFIYLRAARKQNKRNIVSLGNF